MLVLLHWADGARSVRRADVYERREGAGIRVEPRRVAPNRDPARATSSTEDRAAIGKHTRRARLERWLRNGRLSTSLESGRRGLVELVLSIEILDPIFSCYFLDS